MSGHEPIVVVVDAETPGNVGTIARAMKNFGLSDLKLVDPPPLKPDGEAYGFAGHAREDVLPNADTVSFEEIVANYYTVGCTAITGEDSRRHRRFPYTTPAELADSLGSVETKTAIVFGREGRGLYNEEIEQLDQICSIPASDDYPVLNLGQAATIVLYELRELTVTETQLPDREHERPTGTTTTSVVGRLPATMPDRSAAVSVVGSALAAGLVATVLAGVAFSLGVPQWFAIGAGIGVGLVVGSAVEKRLG